MRTPFEYKIYGPRHLRNITRNTKNTHSNISLDVAVLRNGDARCEYALVSLCSFIPSATMVSHFLLQKLLSWSEYI